MTTASAPKYHLITYGCQMNKSDSERIESLLKGVGFTPTDAKEDAAFILINTCSVRQSAEDRVFGQLQNFKALKEENPELLIGVTGCMPGRDRDGAIHKRLPNLVDFYFPTAEMNQLPRWIGERRPELVNSPDLVEDYLKIKPDFHSERQAFVTIQTGCNNFCTYCVVPFARGLEKNRSLKDILEEIEERSAHGTVEITLLGQTVNSYHAPDPQYFSTANPYTHHFAALLWEVNQIQGISRVHFTAPRPRDMTDEVIDAMSLPAHLNFLHIPIQAGSNDVLRRMNRRYTIEEYMDRYKAVQKKHPRMAMGTDIIVGFCGETEKDFEETVARYKECDFDISYTAQYSERSGTAAWRAFKDDVPKEEKKRRWQLIQNLMEETVYRKNQAYVGKTVSVLVERHEGPKITDEMLAMPENIQELMAKQPGTCVGNSRELKLVNFPGSAEKVGEIVDVKIERAEKWILYGQEV